MWVFVMDGGYLVHGNFVPENSSTEISSHGKLAQKNSYSNSIQIVIELITK